jgi:hypothetical protein
MEDSMAFKRDGEVCKCKKGKLYFNTYCGCYICDHCGQHDGLARCFCRWSTTSQGNGYRELEEMGEQIEADY